MTLRASSRNTVANFSEPMPTCPDNLRITQQLQRILSELLHLISRQQAAAADEDASIMVALDCAIECKYDELERATGALLQHRNEHGCGRPLSPAGEASELAV